MNPEGHLALNEVYPGDVDELGGMNVALSEVNCTREVQSTPVISTKNAQISVEFRVALK